MDILARLPVIKAGNKAISHGMRHQGDGRLYHPGPEGLTVARVLADQFFTRYIMPNELHSDLGRTFKSVVFQGFCQLVAVGETITTPQETPVVRRGGQVKMDPGTRADQLLYRDTVRVYLANTSLTDSTLACGA